MKSSNELGHDSHGKPVAGLTRDVIGMLLAIAILYVLMMTGMAPPQ